jgi:hypothetical protein
VEGFQKVLHFGSVAVGCTAERQIKLYNPSAVCIGLVGMGRERQDSGTTGVRAPTVYPSFSPHF